MSGHARASWLSNCYYQRFFIDHLYLQQNTDIGVHINIDSLVSRYFAIVVPRHATVGGKSSGLVIILQTILDTRPAEIDPTIISQCSTLFAMRLSNDHA